MYQRRFLDTVLNSLMQRRRHCSNFGLCFTDDSDGKCDAQQLFEQRLAFMNTQVIQSSQNSYIAEQILAHDALRPSFR